MKKIILYSLLLTPVTGSFLCAFAVLFGIAMIPSVVPAGSLMISVLDAQGLFTKKLVTIYKEQITPKGFLTSFFTPVESMTKEVSIAVRRGTEYVAVDVSRFSNGNHNQMTRTTEKVIVPPFYYEYLTANEHRLYDQVITALAQNNTTFFAEMTAELAEELAALRFKIERAIELQCSQIFEDGIVQLKSAVNINFGRKTASKVNLGAGNYWATGTVDPIVTLKNGCKFLRETGKASGDLFNVIMGESALADFLSNPLVKGRADIRNFKMDDIRAPEMTNGASYHGRVSAGSYNVDIWTYPEVYQDPVTNTLIPYINPKKIVMLPVKTTFTLAFAAVPQLIKDGQIQQKGAYLIQEFYNYEETAHKISIKCAPVAIPTAIDQIYTVQVVA